MEVDQKTALRVMVNLCHATDLEFIKQKTKAGPLFAFMYHARQDALDALKGLVSVDPRNVEDVRKLQNEVQRFIDTVEFTAKVFSDGFDAAVVLREDEASELRDIVAAEGGEVPGEGE